MQIVARNISYALPSGKNLFHNLDFSLNKGDKAALVGDNGIGKSTLLHLLSGEVAPDDGSVQIDTLHWVVPQHFGQYDSGTVAEALQVSGTIEALNAITDGSADPRHYDTLDGDWTIHERVQIALALWDLPRLSATTTFGSLSGGQKTRVFLAGITLHQPQLVMMDEPTNHLDTNARERLYAFVRQSGHDFLIISHDRELLSLCKPIYELSSQGVKTYGGNYAFYEQQKQIEMEAVEQQIQNARQSIAAAKKKQQETRERKDRLNARGKKKARQENLPKILINAAKAHAESSTSRLNEVHEQKIAREGQRLQELSKKRRDEKSIRLTLNDSSLHSGKILFEARQANYAWPGSAPLWPTPLSFTICSGERVRITGDNGSGKSTLIRLLNQDLLCTSGTLNVYSAMRFLLDQEYSLINRDATVLEQAAHSNRVKKPAHELRTLLHRYLFDEARWKQPCHSLSGGEMMRLALCCLALQSRLPDTLILDEPTNNLDLRNVDLLTQAVSDYKGTLIVVSHDKRFVSETGIQREIRL